MRSFCSLAALALSSSGIAQTPPPKSVLAPADGVPPVMVPEGVILERQLLDRDQALFDLQYSASCDVVAMRSFVTDDMEFYHDTEGFAVNSGDQWAADYGQLCAARRSRDEHTRRKILNATVVISRIPNYGAVMTGEHRFFRRQANGSEKLSATARFSKLWRLGADGVWRLARSFSFDHRKGQ